MSSTTALRCFHTCEQDEVLTFDAEPTSRKKNGIAFRSMARDFRYTELVELARLCMRQARLASTNRVAEVLLRMARDYQKRAADLDRGVWPHIEE